MERAHLDKRNSVVVLPGSEPRAAGWNVLQIKLNHVALIIKRSYDIVDSTLKILTGLVIHATDLYFTSR